MSITPRKCKAAALATAPVAAALGAYGFLKGATKFYSSQVNGTPEQYKMTLPGDDLVPEGSPRFKRLTHVEDLDAPCDEVWKHVYQLNTTTAGFYSFTFFEKMFGLSVDNTFMVEQAWQAPDYYKPGDMFCWSYAGFGAEVADMVPGKYLVWFADTRDGTRTPGASFLLPPGMPWNRWSWVIALEPLDSGNRTRIYSRWNISASEESSPISAFFMDLVMMDGGGMMNRRMFQGLEKAAVGTARKNIFLRAYQRFMGKSYGTDDDLQYRVPYPEIRWSRDFPRVASERASFTEDPNWPPAPGEEYRADIEGNNARNGWTEDPPAAKDAEAERRAKELAAHLDEMARGRRTAR